MIPFVVGKRAIRNLAVRCENVDSGCDWVGTISTLQEHVTTCGHALLPCPNSCSMGESDTLLYFLRKDLGKHVDEDCPNRKYKCEDCGHEDTYTYITKSHHEDCPVVVLPCPKRPCTEMLQRQYLERHIETECKHAVVCCKYKGLGCEREMKREDMAAHEEDDKRHLRMAIDTTAKLSNCITTLEKYRAESLFRYSFLEAKVNYLEDERVKLRDKIAKLESVDSYTFKVEGVQAIIDRQRLHEDGYYQSPNFYCKGYYMHMCVYPNIGCTQIGVGLYNMDGEDDDLSWPFKADVTITFLNQLEDKSHLVKVEPVSIECGMEEVDFISFPLSELGFNRVKNAHYLRNDSLFVRMKVELIDHKWLECTDL